MIQTSYLEIIFQFHNTILLRKPRSFYEPQLTQHYKKYTPATQPKTLLNLQIFQQLCFWLVSEKYLHCTICTVHTAFSKHLESNCLYIPLYLRKKIFVT